MTFRGSWSESASRRSSGLTALYDAIGVYLDGAADQDGRTIMLLYTDGGDTRSTLTLPELMELLKASDVTVYAIGSLAHQSLSGRLPQERVLRQIAEVTGGQAFFPADVKELDKVYDQVLAELRAQYTIGYLSTNGKRDGTWRKVDVKLNKPGARGLRIRARKGYFAARTTQPLARSSLWYDGRFRCLRCTTASTSCPISSSPATSRRRSPS